MGGEVTCCKTQNLKPAIENELRILRSTNPYITEMAEGSPDPSPSKGGARLIQKAENQIIRIQSWFRGVLSRRLRARYSGLTPATIINYVSSELKANREAARKAEETLGVYLADWDVDAAKGYLELKRPTKDDKGEVYFGYRNRATGVKEGYGQQLFPSGSKYEGFWLDGQFHGKGRYIYENGDYYVGEWARGKADGEGRFVGADGSTYEGGWKGNLHHGEGKEVWKDRTRYVGEYVNGRKEGKGSFVSSDGASYVGEFKNNVICGKGEGVQCVTSLGTYLWPDGRRYEGDWVNSKMNGRGKFYFADGRVYVGEFANDFREGVGVMTWYTRLVIKRIGRTVECMTGCGATARRTGRER